MRKYKRVYVTGGYGFIGRNLIKQLEKTGVRALRSEANLTDFYSVYKEILYLRPDCVVHCGAVMGTPKCNNAGFYAFDVNVKGTWNVITAAEKVNAKFVYCSSSAIYAPTADVITEKSTVNPKTLYPFTKYLGEQVTRFVRPEKALILRLVFAFGPHDGHSGIWTLIDSGLKRKPAFLLMSKNAFKDYIYIDNLTEAIVEALNKDLTGTFNISYGRPRKLEDVVSLTLDKMRQYNIPLPLDIIFRPDKDYMFHHQVSNEKFINATDWRPKISLETGIDLTVRKMRNPHEVSDN